MRNEINNRSQYKKIASSFPRWKVRCYKSSNKKITKQAILLYVFCEVVFFSV